MADADAGTQLPEPVVVPAGRQGNGAGVAAPEATTATAASLTNLIPTEVVVAYTSLIGVLAGVLKDSPDQTYVPLRWSLLIAGALAVVIAVLVGFYARVGGSRRKPPMLELGAGVFAFVAWGLVTPGSALYFVTDPPTLPVTVGVITAVGYFAAAAVFLPLMKPKRKR